MGSSTAAPNERRAVAAIADLGVVAAGPYGAAALAVGRQPAEGRRRPVAGADGARLLLLDEPFRGVDLGARADIGARLRDRRGAHATLVASADVDELLEVADRVVVLHEGAIVHDGPVTGVDREALVHLAAGGVGAAA